jgi:hypothetical protein
VIKVKGKNVFLQQKSHQKEENVKRTFSGTGQQFRHLSETMAFTGSAGKIT